jgi:hypothetical protein
LKSVCPNRFSLSFWAVRPATRSNRSAPHWQAIEVGLNKGLLLVAMEPPASLEEEFNDWYDTEHFPQRSALPGFETASRWTCVSGWPRWLALYDLTSTVALESDAYRAVSGPNSTPWSQRILPRTLGRMRIIAKQLAPGDASGLKPGQISRLLVARYPSAIASDGKRKPASVEIALSAFRALDGVLQLRLFKSQRGEEVDLWMIAAFDHPASPETLMSKAGRLAGNFGADVFGADFFNVYVPYYRK